MNIGKKKKVIKCFIYSQSNQNQWKFKPPRDSMINQRAAVNDIPL